MIWDHDLGRAYLPRVWEDGDEARAELVVLLRGYPGGSPWRQRLTIREIGT